MSRRAVLAAALGLGLLAGPALAADRHLGAFGETCLARLPRQLPEAAEPDSPPRGLRVTVVVDAACAGTLPALRAVAEFRQGRPDADVVLILLDPAALKALPRQALGELLAAAGAPLTWSPARLRALRPAVVPFIRLEAPSGRAVTAYGAPNLAALAEALR